MLTVYVCFCILFQVTNPITKYALTMTPLALSLEELLPLNQQTYPNIIMLRSALVLSSLVVALSVPFFGKFSLTLVY
jgi:vesicular inhibitory amino acid transporter